MSSTVETATEIRPFHVEIAQEQIDDLRRRIEATRWPSKELVDDRSQGVQLATLRELARFWATDYDWRKAEAKLNAVPQFTTEIDGVEIHFIHVRSQHEDAMPLIMTHGWPGSVIELLETVSPLTDPTAHGGRAEDAFHLVLPSIPGYGFSGEPTEVGWDPGRVARAWAELMNRLGYARYVAQGGDVGASVTDAMGRQAPGGLIGIHLNLLVTALAGPQPAESEQERAATDALTTFRTSGFGYFLEQATRPQTIGYALLDSPVALAAWMLDHDTDSYYKISSAFVDGQPAGNLTRDHIVDNITLYWLTSTGASAARSYWESGQATALAAGQAPPEVSIPVGFTTFPDEIFRAPRSWVEKGYPNLTYFNEADRGGHFAAWEEPRALFRGSASRVQVTALRAVGTRRNAEALPFEGRLPGFDGATGWLNSTPLSPDDLRGKVVLVDFWTYTCINWLRTLSYVRAWSEKYRERGLIVIGVHTPEFPFEHDFENVRRMVKTLRVDYPVATDNDFAVWDAFANRYWPALYLVDTEEALRFHHFGEGGYAESERAIQALLGVDEELVSVEGEGLEAQADWDTLESPETYLGYGLAERFASPGGVVANERRAYEAPETLRSNQWALAGEWTIGRHAAVVNEAGGRIAYRFHARDVHLVLAPGEGNAPVAFRVLIDGEPPGGSHGGDVDERGAGVVSEPRLHQLVRQQGRVGDRTFEITFVDPGAQAYAFTFG